MSFFHELSGLGVSDCVIFAGTTPDLSGYYNAADIFVFFPDAEAGSIALLEAMASALPVIVSDSGGFNEVVDLTCGRLVDRMQSSSIAEAIFELASDRSLRERLGENGRRIVVDRFSWDRLAQQLISIIKQPGGATAQIAKRGLLRWPY